MPVTEDILAITTRVGSGGLKKEGSTPEILCKNFAFQWEWNDELLKCYNSYDEKMRCKIEAGEIRGKGSGNSFLTILAAIELHSSSGNSIISTGD